MGDTDPSRVSLPGATRWPPAPGGARVVGDPLHLVGDRQVACEIRTHEPGTGLPPVVGVEIVHRTDLPGQEPVSEWEYGTKPMPSSRSTGNTAGSGSASPQRILRLQCGDRVDGVGASDVVHPGLRQMMCRILPARTSSASTPITSSIGVPGSTRCWCRGRCKWRPVGAAILHGGADVGRLAVQAGTAGMRDHPEFCCQNDVLAGPEGLPDEFLVGVGPAPRRCPGTSRPDRAHGGWSDRLVVVTAGAGCSRTTFHRAQPDPGTSRSRSFTRLHGVLRSSRYFQTTTSGAGAGECLSIRVWQYLSGPRAFGRRGSPGWRPTRRAA